jgi:hypothetical protein
MGTIMVGYQTKVKASLKPPLPLSAKRHTGRIPFDFGFIPVWFIVLKYSAIQ